MSDRITACAKHVVKAFGKFELEPFLNNLQTWLTFIPSDSAVPPAIPTELVGKDSCVVQVQSLLDAKLWGAINAFSKMVLDLSVKLQAAVEGKLQAIDAQKALTEWNQALDGLLDQGKSIFMDFPEVATLAQQVSRDVADSLLRQVGKETATHTTKCLKSVLFVADQMLLPDDQEIKKYSKAEIEAFESDLQKARSLSSALDHDAGTRIRSGLSVVEAIVGFFNTFVCNTNEVGSKTDKLTKYDFQIMSLFMGFKSESPDLSVQVDKLIDMIKVVHFDIETRTVSMLYKKTFDQCFTIIDDIKTQFQEELDAFQKGHGDLTLPSELASVSSVEDVIALERVIVTAFDMERSNIVADAAVGLEAWIKKSESVAKKLKTQPSEICSEAAGLSTWRACMLWVCPGQVSGGWVQGIAFNFQCSVQFNQVQSIKSMSQSMVFMPVRSWFSCKVIDN